MNLLFLLHCHHLSPLFSLLFPSSRKKKRKARKPFPLFLTKSQVAQNSESPPPLPLLFSHLGFCFHSLSRFFIYSFSTLSRIDSIFPLLSLSLFSPPIERIQSLKLKKLVLVFTYKLSSLQLSRFSLPFSWKFVYGSQFFFPFRFLRKFNGFRSQ